MSQLPIPPQFQHDLALIQQSIIARFDTRADLLQMVQQSPEYRERAQLHALLVIAAAHLGTYQYARVQHAATAIELIAAALLVHEHDAATVEPSGNGTTPLLQGNLALMLGDYLLALAAGEMAKSPDNRVIAFFSQAVQAASEGNLTQLELDQPLERAVQSYRFRASACTAALMVAALKAGTACGSGDEAMIETMGVFGERFGVAYQMMRDARDTDGTQLKQGAITLPALYAAAEQGALPTGLPRTQWVAEMLAAIRRTGADSRTEQEALQQYAAALETLHLLPETLARSALEHVAWTLLTRDQPRYMP